SSNKNAANEAFQKAADYYSELISAGIKNGSLYYNLGNTYVRLHKIGFAILNYRRSLLYSPNNQQVWYNLDYARSLQKNGFESNTENEVLHIIFFLHYLIPISIKVTILIVVNAAFWLFLILRRFGYKWNIPLVVALIILLFSAASVFVDMRNSKVLHGVVTADETIGRLGDNKSYESAFDGSLYDGVEFTVKQRRAGWVLAELPDNNLVWIEGEDCMIIEE
ncbi:MAG: hypothetical protein PQJ46_14235, partial [Spirochaetales bacterium]|nr:hypothetical protein [Spirochaetales bacterium]